jgi:hypothetical protein
MRHSSLCKPARHVAIRGGLSSGCHETWATDEREARERPTVFVSQPTFAGSGDRASR